MPAYPTTRSAPSASPARRCSVSAWDCSALASSTGGRWCARRASCTARLRRSVIPVRACSRGCPNRSPRPGITPSSSHATPCPRCSRPRRSRKTGSSWGCGTATSRSKACSSTPNRSSPTGGTSFWRTSLPRRLRKVRAPARDLGQTVVEQRSQYLAVDLGGRDRTGAELRHDDPAALTERARVARLAVFRLLPVHSAGRARRQDRAPIARRWPGGANCRAKVHHCEQPIARLQPGSDLANARLGIEVGESRAAHALAHTPDVDLDADAVVVVDLRGNRGGRVPPHARQLREI